MVRSLSELMIPEFVRESIELELLVREFPKVRVKSPTEEISALLFPLLLPLLFVIVPAAKLSLALDKIIPALVIELVAVISASFAENIKALA